MESVKSAALPGAILQLKVRLLGISPMVWRRVLVPNCVSLRELHGVVQLAMDWEGIHLFEFAVRGVRYAGPDLSGTSTDVPLSDLRFRRNAKFRYVYDMFCEWEHEIRVEERLAAAPGKRYPQCVGGAGACPPEDCGGPDAYHARREEATGLDAMNDLAVVADTVERVLIDKDSTCLDDEDTRWRLEVAVERLDSHARFLETTFSRGAVNRRFRAGDQAGVSQSACFTSRYQARSGSSASGWRIQNSRSAFLAMTRISYIPFSFKGQV